MSHNNSSSTSSNFKLIFDNALKMYKKRTKNDLLTHPLALRLRGCNSRDSILTVLRELVQDLNESQSGNMNWLYPTVNVLLAFSATLGEGVGSVFSPAKVIFIGFGVLLSTAKDVRADQDKLFEMLERIEAFFRRLDIYTKVAPNQGMVDTITEIMVEVVNILAIVTKEIKKGRMKKYIMKIMKKLIENNDIGDVLNRLDRLTQEEARMASAQLLEITNAIDSEVREIAGNVLVIDDRVASVDDRMTGVDERMAGFNHNVKAVDDKLEAVIDDGKEARGVIQQTADDVDQVKRSQLRQDLRRWLSPPDPSTNHNIACNAHHTGTATWFFEGRTYNEWKSTGAESLLWIHGKPGSGKSILCSAIIQDIKAMCDAGQASMAYFYFDFRDIDKQHWRGLIPSLLIQLSAQSGPRCDILSRLHSNHDSGAGQPNDDVLTQCLKEMVTLSDHRPIYLIFDALDECSNFSGIPTSRRRVLQLVKELVDLHLPTLHICVTSRPEVDIRDVLESLTSYRVSLHDQSGQQKDIEDYVRSVVYSNSEPIMRRWRKEDKDLVIKTLSELADGMFRWIFCQLEVLRDCLPSSVRHTLNELPESLDETYERILKEIKKPNRAHARRVLQCLVVAARPLRVEELAEVLAVDFDDAEGIPMLKPHWRWDEQELALVSACSSLIAIIEESGSRIVQFSHFSVKEFLTSSRLATASGEVSNYYIDSEPAHTILGQACLGVLLQIQVNADGHTPEDHPLALYAAERWTAHAQVGEVSSRLHKAMKYLFDVNKPHFEVWRTLCDIDTVPSGDATFYRITQDGKYPAAPLYYAALCGFHDLVQHLITKHPQDVNAHGGWYLRPLVAALAGEHFRTADFLHHNDAHPNVRGYDETTPLHSASTCGNYEAVQKLIEYGTDINPRDHFEYTPLHDISDNNSQGGSIARLLLEHGADINAQEINDQTPLHMASFDGMLEIVRELLKHSADLEVKDSFGKTALQIAVERGHDDVMKLLQEHETK